MTLGIFQSWFADSHAVGVSGRIGHQVLAVLAGSPRVLRITGSCGWPVDVIVTADTILLSANKNGLQYKNGLNMKSFSNNQFKYHLQPFVESLNHAHKVWAIDKINFDSFWIFQSFNKK